MKHKFKSFSNFSYSYNNISDMLLSTTTNECQTNTTTKMIYASNSYETTQQTAPSPSNATTVALVHWQNFLIVSKYQRLKIYNHWKFNYLKNISDSKYTIIDDFIILITNFFTQYHNKWSNSEDHKIERQNQTVLQIEMRYLSLPSLHL